MLVGLFQSFSECNPTLLNRVKLLMLTHRHCFNVALVHQWPPPHTFLMCWDAAVQNVHMVMWDFILYYTLLVRNDQLPHYSDRTTVEEEKNNKDGRQKSGNAVRLQEILGP